MGFYKDFINLSLEYGAHCACSRTPKQLDVFLFDDKYPRFLYSAWGACQPYYVNSCWVLARKKKKKGSGVGELKVTMKASLHSGVGIFWSLRLTVN